MKLNRLSTTNQIFSWRGYHKGFRVTITENFVLGRLTYSLARQGKSLLLLEESPSFKTMTQCIQHAKKTIECHLKEVNTHYE